MDKIITVKVSAGARTEKLTETSPDSFKARVQTPPEKGRANERVAELLAEHFSVPISHVTLLRGSIHRDKRFLIKDSLTKS